MTQTHYFTYPTVTPVRHRAHDQAASEQQDDSARPPARDHVAAPQRALAQGPPPVSPPASIPRA